MFYAFIYLKLLLITSNCRHFGVAGTSYDFGSQNGADMKKRLEQLEEAQARLAKNINRKVMNMIDRYICIYIFISIY